MSKAWNNESLLVKLQVLVDFLGGKGWGSYPRPKWYHLQKYFINLTSFRALIHIVSVRGHYFLNADFAKLRSQLVIKIATCLKKASGKRCRSLFLNLGSPPHVWTIISINVWENLSKTLFDLATHRFYCVGNVLPKSHSGLSRGKIPWMIDLMSTFTINYKGLLL